MTASKYQTLIQAQDLNAIIDSSELRIFDCRFNLMKVEQGRRDYAQGHIPKAQYADLNLQLAGPVTVDSGRHPLPDKPVFEQQLRAWGIDDSSQIIVYDDANGAIAARMWWLCLWAGLTHVAVLDGGIDAWLNQGGSLSTAVPAFGKTDYLAEFDDELWVSTAQIEKQSFSHNNAMLTDARAEARYLGQSEPIDPVAGHIPGAINLPFEQNLNQQGLFQDPQALRKHHQADGLEQVISMCGSGVTACHNMLARAHAGLDMGLLYVGSWSEWIRDSKREIA